jgi:hypothetical protein
MQLFMMNKFHGFQGTHGNNDVFTRTEGLFWPLLIELGL